MRYRHSIDFTVKKYGCPEIAAEIGVRSGENAHGILAAFPIKYLILVDSYIAYNDEGSTISQANQNVELWRMLTRLRDNLHRVVFMQMTSVEANKFFQDNFFDYIYIDADHSYEHIKQDIGLWYPKVKKNGVLAGHDYNVSSYQGIVKAVNEFIDVNNLTLVKFEDTDWLIEKK